MVIHEYFLPGTEIVLRACKHYSSSVKRLPELGG